MKRTAPVGCGFLDQFVAVQQVRGDICVSLLLAPLLQRVGSRRARSDVADAVREVYLCGTIVGCLRPVHTCGTHGEAPMMRRTSVVEMQPSFCVAKFPSFL